MYRRTVLRSSPHCRAISDHREPLPMQIQDHHHALQPDHRPIPPADRESISTIAAAGLAELAPQARRTRPAWGVFKRRFWGASLRYQQSKAAFSPTASAGLPQNRGLTVMVRRFGMDQQSSASNSLAPLGMELFAINLQFSQSDGGHASVSGVHARAQGDEKLVQLLERLAPSRPCSRRRWHRRELPSRDRVRA